MDSPALQSWILQFLLSSRFPLPAFCQTLIRVHILLFLMSRNLAMGTCTGRPNTTNLEITLIRDPATRNAMWEEYYFHQWGMLANRDRQIIMKTFWENTNTTRIDELLKENSEYRQMIRTGSSQAVAREVMIAALNQLVAQEVVKTTIGGTVRLGGLKWGMSAFAETTTLRAVCGTSAMHALASVSVGPVISSIVGEQVARIAGQKFGVTDEHAKDLVNFSGVVAGGALAGAFLRGPTGVFAGAALGGFIWGLGELISGAVKRTTKVPCKVPRDDWCFCEIGSLGNGEDHLCFGTYNAVDTVYRATFQHEYRGQDSNWVMNAGQPHDGSFQLCIWAGNAMIKLLQTVYHRDRIRVIRKKRAYYIAHCKGQFHPGNDSGTTVVYKIKIRRH